MTLDEAFTKFAATRSHGLPWEIGADDLRAIFTAGWHAHYEAGRQTDMFPGTLNANVAQSVEQLFCKQPVVGSIPSVGSNSDAAAAKFALENAPHDHDHLPITAEMIYAAYPRKVGKQAAVKAINKAAKRVGSLSELLFCTKAYAAATATWPAADKQFIPHPATWFNRGSYDDDPKEWVRGAAATPSQFTRKYE